MADIETTDDARREWHPIGVQFVHEHNGQFFAVIVDAMYYPSSSEVPMLRYRLRQGDSPDDVSFDNVGELLPGDPVDIVEYIAWAEQHADEIEDIRTEGVWMFAMDHLERCEASLRTLAGNCSDVETTDKVLGVVAQLQAIRMEGEGK